MNGPGGRREIPRSPAVRQPNVMTQQKEKIMSFGLNRTEVIGRLGAGGE